jgi:DNA-binding PadR family transcriptional regulator
MLTYDPLFIGDFAPRLFAVGRRGGRHLHGHGGRGFFGGPGGGDLPGARRLGSADLQLLILALLEERAWHGYKLIKTIEERSGGFYSPSPGVIYPALTFLEEIGHAHIEQKGARKLCHITPEGRAHLAAHRATADAILDALSRIGGRMDDVREAYAGTGDLDGGASDELHRARHALKHALFRKRGCDAAEARRIAEILDRATAEIIRD